MGAWCATTSCGKAFIEWKALKALNAEGFFTPEQISTTCEKNWKYQNADDAMTIDKEHTMAGVKDAVNYLGSIGDGLTFQDDKFESTYKKFCALTFGKTTRIQFDGMITAMTFKDKK